MIFATTAKKNLPATPDALRAEIFFLVYDFFFNVFAATPPRYALKTKKNRRKYRKQRKKNQKRAEKIKTGYNPVKPIFST